MASNSAREANRIYSTNAFTGGGAKVVSLVHMDCVAPPLNLTEQKTAPEQASTPLCERGGFCRFTQTILRAIQSSADS